MPLPLLICVDGRDYSGKTSVLKSIHETLVESGKIVKNLPSFPGHFRDETNNFTNHEKIKLSIANRRNVTHTVTNEKCTLFSILADFQMFIEDYYKCRYSNYDVVLLDRFIASNAHQVAKYPEFCTPIIKTFVEQNSDFFAELNYVNLDVDQETMLKRHEARGDVEFNPADLKSINEYDLTSHHDVIQLIGESKFKSYKLIDTSNKTIDEIVSTVSPNSL